MPLPTGHYVRVRSTSNPVSSTLKPNQPSLFRLTSWLNPMMKPDVAQLAPARPYNLHQLVSDRAMAEADLDGMMSPMRGKMMKER